MDPLTLTAQLNALLQAIDLPFVLTSPVDLTPSLLITIFESITQVPIPIAHAIDQEEQAYPDHQSFYRCRRTRLSAVRYRSGQS